VGIADSCLGAAVGLPATQLWSMQPTLPRVRFAVDAYVSFARRQPWQEAVCTSLTELFAPSIHRERLATWPVHYPWTESRGLGEDAVFDLQDFP
jgi:pyrroloquinoline-quinone synthase